MARRIRVIGAGIEEGEGDRAVAGFSGGNQGAHRLAVGDIALHGDDVAARFLRQQLQFRQTARYGHHPVAAPRQFQCHAAANAGAGTGDESRAVFGGSPIHGLPNNDGQTAGQ